MSGFQATWDLFSKHEHKAFIQYIPEVKRIKGNKINKVAAGGGGGVNMTLQEQGTSSGINMSVARNQSVGGGRAAPS